MLAGSLCESLHRCEALRGVELVPVCGAVCRLQRQPVVLGAQLLMFDGDALGERGLLGFFGRLDLSLRLTQPALKGFVSGPVIVHDPLGLVEVPHGPFEKIAPALHPLAR